jgi:hypothetical protein
MDLYHEIGGKSQLKPQLIMVLVAKKEPALYGLIKHLADVTLQVREDVVDDFALENDHECLFCSQMPTQFVLAKNVRGKQRGPDPSTIHNILLKLNSKLLGKNQVLAPNPTMQMFKRPIMFVGADVTHASPDARGTKPSIAAMVASMDPYATLYRCEIRLQGGTQVKEVIEVIEDTENMVKSLLKAFYENTNGKKPEKIIFYRDGVSEGQFQDVLNSELEFDVYADLSLMFGRSQES